MIVRAATTHHFRKGKQELRENIFIDAAERDELSVVRHDFKTADFCKSIGKLLTMPTAHPPIEYKGLAILRAGAIRACGSKIMDAREETFEGHAHIQHGMMKRRDDPQDAPAVMALRDRAKALLHFTKYYPDTNPNNDTWDGPTLLPPKGKTTTRT